MALSWCEIWGVEREGRRVLKPWEARLSAVGCDAYPLEVVQAQPHRIVSHRLFSYLPNSRSQPIEFVFIGGAVLIPLQMDHKIRSKSGGYTIVIRGSDAHLFKNRTRVVLYTYLALIRLLLDTSWALSRHLRHLLDTYSTLLGHFCGTFSALIGHFVQHFLNTCSSLLAEHVLSTSRHLLYT